MATHTARVHVSSRNNLGQWAKQLEHAGSDTVQDMVDEGAKLSRAMAPTGEKFDRRTLTLKDSIRTQMHGRTNGSWYSVARHALPVEKGARAHLIVGDPFVKFFWERMGRMWIPGLFGEPDVIHHPGNQAQPFLQPALSIVMSKWRSIANRHYGAIR